MKSARRGYTTAPAGWVLLAADRLTTEQAITALRAGPIAQAVYGAAGVLVVLAAKMPWFPTLVLVVGLGEITINAFGNLRVPQRRDPRAVGLGRRARPRGALTAGALEPRSPRRGCHTRGVWPKRAVRASNGAEIRARS